MDGSVDCDDDDDGSDGGDGDDGGDSGDGVVGGNDGQMLALMFNQSILSPIPDELLDVLIICTFVDFYVIFDNFICTILDVFIIPYYLLLLF